MKPPVFLLFGLGFFVLFIFAYFSEIQPFSYLFLFLSAILVFLPSAIEKKRQPSKEVLELESQMKGKFAEPLVVEGEPIWAGWCPVHIGAPPPFDPKGYKCQNCAKLVCARCLYVTQKAALCFNCFNKLPEEERRNLHPFYDDSMYSQTRINYLRFEAISFGLLLIMMSVYFIILAFNVVDAEKIGLVILALTATLLLAAIGGQGYFFLKTKKEEKVQTIE
jgi:hypothetical protein